MSMPISIPMRMASNVIFICAVMSSSLMPELDVPPLGCADDDDGGGGVVLVVGVVDGVGADGPPPASAEVATATETPTATTPAAIARAVRCLIRLITDSSSFLGQRSPLRGRS